MSKPFSVKSPRSTSDAGTIRTGGEVAADVDPMSQHLTSQVGEVCELRDGESDPALPDMKPVKKPFSVRK